MENCNTGINIPILPEEPCQGVYTPNQCIVHPQAIVALNLPANSTENAVILALVAAIQTLNDRVEALENL